MRASATAFFAILVTIGLASTGIAWAQQQRWAAIDPNREVSSTVAWGATEAQAKERAVDVCEKVSKTCANGPATTNHMEDVFAVMCCSRPRHGCAAAAAESREDATASVRKNLTEAGFSSCTLRHYMSAGTGKKQ